MNVLNKMRNSCGWRSGAKQMSIDAMIPLFAVPAITIIAAQTVYLTVITFITTPVIVYHLDHNFLRFLPRSKFFIMWTITSVIIMLSVFEMCVVPLLEILPEENLIFVAGVVGGIACGHKTRINADCLAQDGAVAAVAQELELEEGTSGTEDDDFCVTCRKKTPPRAYHCRICQTCVLGREYHCKWLDCCIGANNLKWYLGCLISSTVAFIYGSNLTMTSVCHPFILIGTILLPDDCSDVYHQLDLALCFVSAVYSLIVGIIVFGYLVYHLWLLYLGTTANERRRLTSSDSHQTNCRLFTSIAQLVCCRC
ncbi:palmitoyltransferase ZDHHC23-B [Microplitis demolitor]|uniref:palmitoyltransferase ZDHHC23-B n=1 Tax=Microplitis demolitor TaxID=69319 RepID=UPI0004CD9A6B|nr:palmitoyltransferase ZDHHC23-B [Microplitis demolitor]